MIQRFLVCIEEKCIQYGSDFLYRCGCPLILKANFDLFVFHDVSRIWE